MNQINHTPVMLNEVLNFLNPKNKGLYIDCTFGGGGYTKSLLNFKSKVLSLILENSIESGASMSLNFAIFIKFSDIVI